MKMFTRKLLASLAAAVMTVSIMALPVSAADGKWQKDSTGWWYSYSDGTYARNCWQKIGGEWYAFDQHGYMRTGWFEDKGEWYFLDKNGAMVTGWSHADDGNFSYSSWYYFSPSGAMQTGWLYDRGEWYYLHEDGWMMKYQDIIWNGKTYHLNADGTMAKNETYPWKNTRCTADGNGVVTAQTVFEDVLVDCPEGWSFDSSEYWEGPHFGNVNDYSMWYHPNPHMGEPTIRILTRVLPEEELKMPLEELKEKYWGYREAIFNPWTDLRPEILDLESEYDAAFLFYDYKDGVGFAPEYFYEYHFIENGVHVKIQTQCYIERGEEWEGYLEEVVNSLEFVWPE